MNNVYDTNMNSQMRVYRQRRDVDQMSSAFLSIFILVSTNARVAIM